MLTNVTRYQAIQVAPRSQQPTLTDLLDRMARREQSALAAFYDQTHRLVFGLLLALLRERTSAEAVLLEVYEQVWQQTKQAQKLTSLPLAWLLSLARTLALEHLLTLPEQRRVKSRLNSLAEPINDTAAAECGAVTRRRHHVQRALMRLPADQRYALELACFAGLTYTEIAHQLNCAPEEIKTQLVAGMRTIRAYLQP